MATIKQVPGGLEYVYQEPTTNKNGSPLVDLVNTSIYHDIGAGPVKDLDIPATSPNGGGTITQVIQNPIGEDQEATVQVWATATDDAGLESARGAEVSIDVDNLPPSPPL